MNPSNQTLICGILKEAAEQWHTRSKNFLSMGDLQAAQQCVIMSKINAHEADEVSQIFDECGHVRFAVRGKRVSVKNPTH